MFVSKAVRAATLAVAGAFLLSSLPALAVPMPPLKPAGIEQSAMTEIAAKTDDKNKKKKKPAKKTSGKKKPAKKKTTTKPA